MMLQILKKQKFNNLFFNKIIIIKSFIALFAISLFADNSNNFFKSNLLTQTSKKFSDEDYDKFILGRSFFNNHWVQSPSSTTARDGLGPLFSANSCLSCHPKNGRGNLFSKDASPSSALIAKLSVKSNNSLEHQKLLKYNGFIPDETYGNQISSYGIFGVDFEAKINIDFEEKKIVFPDGYEVILLKPKYSLKNLNYGPLDNNINISYRLAQTLNGMGLIELISNDDILANEDVYDKNGDGISGKANWVYSKITKKYELGRYTWKASVSSLKEQIANAALNDIGLTTTINPNNTCTDSQTACKEAAKKKIGIDLPDHRLDAITFYLENINTFQAKQANKNYKEGLTLFKEISCAKCHIEKFSTSKGFDIFPFSDFLLHDMGEELADGRDEFLAKSNEWRTAPLWGLSLHEAINNKKPRLLHDGRARNFEEAILWHGGEATNSKLHYMNLPLEKRQQLIKFLEEL